jgi:hypothetical protein
MRPIVEDLMLVALVPGAALAAPVSLKSINDTCIESELQNCTVAASGFVAPQDTTRLAYQIQRGVDEYDGIAGGVVVFSEVDGKWELLAKDFSGVWYQLPRLSEAEPIVFHVPGVTAGTGSFNADLLFEFVLPESTELPHWQRVDMDSWWEAIDGKLPKGLEIWKGVSYDFGEAYWGQYVARTSLWQETDGNCCPTGGSAVIHFTIEDGALKAGDVDYEEPKEEAE